MNCSQAAALLARCRHYPKARGIRKPRKTGKRRGPHVAGERRLVKPGERSILFDDVFDFSMKPKRVRKVQPTRIQMVQPTRMKESGLTKGQQTFADVLADMEQRYRNVNDTSIAF
jgi:hypothetical protein